MIERIASRYLRDSNGNEFGPIRGMEGPIRFKNGQVLYYDPREKNGVLITTLGKICIFQIKKWIIS